MIKLRRTVRLQADRVCRRRGSDREGGRWSIHARPVHVRESGGRVEWIRSETYGDLRVAYLPTGTTIYFENVPYTVNQFGKLSRMISTVE